MAESLIRQKGWLKMRAQQKCWVCFFMGGFWCGVALNDLVILVVLPASLSSISKTEIWLKSLGGVQLTKDFPYVLF
jgi:hypothetical protein